MKSDVQNLHYETLFRIVIQRYKGVTPISIKKYLLAEIDFDFKTDAKSDAEYLDKKNSYINKEVNNVLKKLSNKPITDDIKEGFPPDEEESSEEQIEDYEEYPHTLIIGIPEVLSNGKKAQRNSSYRLNTNIKFSLHDNNDNYELLLATRHLYHLFMAKNMQDVNDPMVAFLTQRNNDIDDDYGWNELKLITDTFVQLNTHEIYNPKKEYHLSFLLQLISLKADLNITIQNSKSTFTMNNVAINELVFGTDKFNMVCDEMSVTINNMNDIKSIESNCDTSLKENILSVRKIVENYPSFVNEYFESKIENLEGVHEMFFQSIE